MINDYPKVENNNYLSLDNDIIDKINKFDNYKLSVKELRKNSNRIKECLLKNILSESYKLEIIDPIFYKDVFKNKDVRSNIRNSKYWKGLLDIIELYCKYRKQNKKLYVYIKDAQLNKSPILDTVKQNIKMLREILYDAISVKQNINKIEIKIELCKDVEHQRLWHFYKNWHRIENEYVINTNYGLDLFTEKFDSEKKMINITKLNPDLDFNIDKFESEDLTIKLKF
jgi:chromatin segregation and condensation protein Rec8/ScpA/Scc1 (kleisin family)